uniref:Uncharacterized protein n=1 Tax=Populus alba TaxID=43335 RepID=A0A4U5QAD2_POPAL|nr:hypothetical protein D5086_0000133920 [Populus alba]
MNWWWCEFMVVKGETARKVAQGVEFTGGGEFIGDGRVGFLPRVGKDDHIKYHGQMQTGNNGGKVHGVERVHWGEGRVECVVEESVQVSWEIELIVGGDVLMVEVIGADFGDGGVIVMSASRVNYMNQVTVGETLVMVVFRRDPSGDGQDLMMTGLWPAMPPGPGLDWCGYVALDGGFEEPPPARTLVLAAIHRSAPPLQVTCPADFCFGRQDRQFWIIQHGTNPVSLCLQDPRAQPVPLALAQVDRQIAVKNTIVAKHQTTVTLPSSSQFLQAEGTPRSLPIKMTSFKVVILADCLWWNAASGICIDLFAKSGLQKTEEFT